ncbi:PAS domain S-box protein, partial [Desulfonatronospira sp.]|uniref:PAS domain S-box protein n=1 Tax=Desulfonatronospira sp. TaxID=1962951 RepID=UPI0025C739F1
MQEKSYKRFIDCSFFGYAYHRIILDDQGRPKDYEFLEVNAGFEKMTGLKAENILGRRVTEVLPGIQDDPFDWIGFYGKIALERTEEELEQHFEPLNSWYKIIAYSPEEHHFVTIIQDITSEKEQALQMERFFSVNLDLLCIADTAGNFVKVNTEWESVLGYTAQELEQRTFLEFVHPDDIDSTLAAMAELEEQKPVLQFVNRYRCKDDSYRHIEWRAHPHGTLIYAAARDVTDRIRAEEALARSAQEQSILLDNIPTQVWYLTSEHSYGAVNKAHADFCGMQNIDMAFKDMYDIFTKDIVEVCRRRNVDVFSTGRPVRTEEWVPDATGEQRLLSILKSPKIADNGTVEYVVCSAEDITDRKRAEVALQKARDEYQSITDLTGDIIVQVDTEGRWTFLNDYARVFWGDPGEKLLGRLFSDYLHPDDQEATSAAVQEMIKSEYPLKGLVNRQWTPRGWRIVQWNGAPLYKDGAYTGFQATGRDITEQREKEKQLQDSEQRLNTLISQTPAVIYSFIITEGEPQVTYVNENVKHVLGFEPKDFLNNLELFKQCLHPDDAQKVFDALPVLMEEGRVTLEEYRFRDKAGNYRWLHDEQQLITHADGTLEVVGAWWDVTERRQSEHQLQNNLRFQEIISDISSSFVRTTRESFDRDINSMLSQIGNHFQVDRSYLFLFSHDQKTMTNTHEWCSRGISMQMDSVQDLPLDSLPWFKEQILSGQPVHVPDVHALPGEASAEKGEFTGQDIKSLICIPVKSSDRIWGFIGCDAVKDYYSWSSIEIVNLKTIANIIGDLLLKQHNEKVLMEARNKAQESEESLRENQQRLDTLLSNTPAVIYTYQIDARGNVHITYINDNVSKVVGFRPEDFTSDMVLWANCVHPEDVPKIQEKLSAKNMTSEYRFKDKKGSYHWLLDTQKVLKRDDAYTEMIGTWWDITEQKEAELALLQSEKQLNMFFSQSFSGFFFMMLDEPVAWNQATEDEKADLLEYVMTHQRMTRVNQAMLDQYGAKEEDFIGLT